MDMPMMLRQVTDPTLQDGLPSSSGTASEGFPFATSKRGLSSQTEDDENNQGHKKTCTVPPPSSAKLPKSDKDVTKFRDFNGATNTVVPRLRQQYKWMREKSTVAFYDRMIDKFGKFDHATWTIREAFDALGDFRDALEPDLELPNFVHGLQTAEGMRQAGMEDWLVLVGLLHDMGKIMFVWGDGEDGMDGSLTGPQWALGGDTWVVGCAIPDSVVFSDLNSCSPDMTLSQYRYSCRPSVESRWVL
jgi:inositol oxygenase